MMKKKILSMALALCLAFGTAAALPNSVFTADTGITASAEQYGNFNYTVSDGKVCITGYTGSEENVTVPDKIAGYPVTSIGKNAFEKCKTIKTIKLPSSLKTLGENAFEWCKNLESIVLPNGLQTIGNDAFRDCTNLKSLSVPDTVTAIGYSAFNDCSSLETIKLSNNIKELKSNTFFGCTSLKSVTVPASVEKIADSAFSYCRSWTELKVDSKNKNYVSKDNAIYSKDMKTLYLYAQGITDPFAVPSGVTAIAKRAFFSANITSISFPSTLVSIGDYAFCCCDFTSLTIPGNVKTIGSYAFDTCYEIQNLILKDGIQTIEYGAFYNCNFRTVRIPDSVTSIGNRAFGYYYHQQDWAKYPGFTITCNADTAASQYASENKFRSNVIYDSHEITHDTTYHEAKKATCTQDGNIEYWYCNACGRYYKDAANKQEITKSQAIISKTGHDWGAWETTKAATPTTQGQQQRTCKTCKEVQKRYYSYDVSTAERLAGSNRYKTAVEISKANYEKAKTVVLAYGLNYADALAGGPLAAELEAPILLTETIKLPDVTLAEIKRLGATNVIILGGTGVISESVEKSLKSISGDMKVERIAGKNRYETSALIAKRVKAGHSVSLITNYYFVCGTSFADALSVSAAACRNQNPIIYVDPTGSMDRSVRSFLYSISGYFENAYIIGGTGVISEGAKEEIDAYLEGETIRIAGNDRYETNVAVNKMLYSGSTNKSICVATGCDFPDALVGGVLAGNKSMPMMFVNGKAKNLKLSDSQKEFLFPRRSGKVYVLGGEGAVPSSHVNTILKEING